MTPERLVRWWVRFYTRDLPAPVAERRIGEIDSDVHDHVAHERAQGNGDGRIALGLLSRMVRGMPADASWHRRNATTRRTALLAAVRVVLITSSLLLIPLVAMQLSDEWAWGVFDFVFAATLIGGTLAVFELAVRRARNMAYRAAAGLALAAAFMLVWVVGAVGVIGEDGDPADLMYGGVLAIGVVGAVAVRFRPGGMARVLVAMALAQALVTAIALLLGKHHEGTATAAELVGLNAFFAALFAGSALLFTRAAAAQPAART